MGSECLGQVGQDKEGADAARDGANRTSLLYLQTCTDARTCPEFCHPPKCRALTIPDKGAAAHSPSPRAQSVGLTAARTPLAGKRRVSRGSFVCEFYLLGVGNCARVVPCCHCWPSCTAARSPSLSTHTQAQLRFDALSFCTEYKLLALLC